MWFSVVDASRCDDKCGASDNGSVENMASADVCAKPTNSQLPFCLPLNVSDEVLTLSVPSTTNNCRQRSWLRARTHRLVQRNADAWIALRPPATFARRERPSAMVKSRVPIARGRIALLLVLSARSVLPTRKFALLATLPGILSGPLATKLLHDAEATTVLLKLDHR